MDEMQHNDKAACIEAYEKCAQECKYCAAYCSGHDQPEMAEYVLACLDCADICEATLKAVRRDSKHRAEFCALCESICRACAEHCAQHVEQYEHCRDCRDACLECADACARHAGEKPA
jgi:hypothetical protein